MDGSSVRLYVDGAEVGSPTDASGSAIDYGLPDTTFEVGNFHACSGFGYTGAIDEVSVYGRALSAAEIASLQSGTSSTPPQLSRGFDDHERQLRPRHRHARPVGHLHSVRSPIPRRTRPDHRAARSSFQSDSPGTFSNPGATCSLGSGPNHTSLCAVTYTPTATASGVPHHHRGLRQRRRPRLKPRARPLWR